MEQWTGSKLGKQYVKVAYCHPAYLTYMQNTSCKILSWTKYKQEEKGMTEHQMVGWHHHVNGHELEQVPQNGEG